MGNATVGVYKDDKLISNVNTDVDGYTFTHLLSNQTYVLKSKDFEAKIITITNSEPIVQNITGKFELGKKYSDDMVNYHLKSNVINVDDGQYQTNTDDGKKVVLSKEIDARVGDIMIIPPSKIYETPKAIKVTSVNHFNNETVIEYSTPSLYEVINNIKVKSWKSDISRATFIPAEGVKVNTEKNSDRSLYRSVTVEGKFKPSSISLAGKVKGVKVEGNINFNIAGEISSDAIELGFYLPKINFMNLDIKGKLNLSTEGSVSAKLFEHNESDKIKSSSENSLKFKIGRLILPTTIFGFNVEYDLNMVSTIDGEFSLTLSNNFSIENAVSLSNWKPKYDKNIEQRSDITELSVKGEVKIGPELSATGKIFHIDLLTFSAEAGLGAEASYKSRINSKIHKFSIEKFAYLTLKSKLDILKAMKEFISFYDLDLNPKLEHFNHEFVFFDGKIALNKEWEINNNKEDIEVKERLEDIYKKFTNSFVYSGGAGNSVTVLRINKDGSFEGRYQDMDMGVNGPNYPQGTLYFSNFKGRLKNLTKIDDFEYNVTVEDLSYSDPEGEKIDNGFRVIVDNNSILEKNRNFTIYLPGKSSNQIPKQLNRWYDYLKENRPNKLNKTIIYGTDMFIDFIEFTKY